MNETAKHPYQVAVDFINEHGERGSKISTSSSPYRILKALSLAKGERMNGAKNQVSSINQWTNKQLNKKVREVLSLFCEKGIFVLPKEFNVRRPSVSKASENPQAKSRSEFNRLRNKSSGVRNPKELATVLAQKHKDGSIVLSNSALISVATALDNVATEGQVRVMVKEAITHDIKLGFK